MLRGYLDQATRQHVRGWAFDEAQPDVPVHVVVSVNGEVLARVLANRQRDDVEALHGSGRHGFDIYLPGLCALRRHRITARIEGCDEDLMYSPIIVEPADSFDAEVAASLGRLIAGADLATLDRAATVLAEHIEGILDQRAALQSHEVLRHFRHRWFRHRGASPPDRAPDPPARALIIDSTRPDTNDNDSKTIESYALSLRRLGYDVTFVPADLSRPAADDVLDRAGVQFHYRPYTASAEEVLRRQQGAFDVLLVHRLVNAVRYIPLARHHCPNARIVYSRPATADPLPPGGSTGVGRVGFAEAMARHRRAELATASQADAVVTSCNPVAERLRSALPEAGVHVVPWSMPVRPTMVSFERRHGVAVLGLTDSLHNPGVRWLIDTVAAAVWSRDPDIECLIRDGAAPELPDGLDGRIARIGPDVTASDLFDRVRLTLVVSSEPAAHRRVAESLAAGVPCIAPADVLRDLAAPPPLFFCDTSNMLELAQAILALHSDVSANLEARKHGLDLIDSNHSAESTDSAMRELLQRRRSARPYDSNLPLMKRAETSSRSSGLESRA